MRIAIRRHRRVSRVVRLSRRARPTAVPRRLTRVPCRASAMPGQCHAMTGQCHAMPCRASAMPVPCTTAVPRRLTRVPCQPSIRPRPRLPCPAAHCAWWTHALLHAAYAQVKITDFGLAKIVDDGDDAIELTSQGYGTYWCAQLAHAMRDCRWAGLARSVSGKRVRRSPIFPCRSLACRLAPDGHPSVL
jgi:hypothetical protein